MRDVTIMVLLGSLVLGNATLTGASAQEAERPEDRPSPSIASVLKEHRHALTLEQGELIGEGAELLLREAGAARYLLVGETHGVAEVPGLVSAAFRQLRDDGYRHLAVEIGPIQGERIGELLAGDRPMEAYRSFLAEHWPGVPFYHWREEARLLADAVEAGGGADVLWGLDYDVFGGRYPLHRLRALAPDSAAHAAATRTVALADSLLRAAGESGDMSRVIMFSRPDTLWKGLRDAYGPEAGSEAARILFQLAATSRINEAWTAGRRWESNHRRIGLLKHNFLRHRLASDPEAKVVVKTGAYHVMRGRTPTDVLDVGNLLSELSLAEAARTRRREGGAAAAGPDDGDLAESLSFHVIVLGGPGRERAAPDPTASWNVRHVPTLLSRPDHWAAPLAKAAFDGRWTLLDLRPLRPLVSGGELGEVDPALERMIFAVDAAVVLPGSTPATALDPEAGDEGGGAVPGDEPSIRR